MVDAGVFSYLASYRSPLRWPRTFRCSADAVCLQGCRPLHAPSLALGLLVSERGKGEGVFRHERCAVVPRNDVERRFTSFGLEVGHSRSGSISFRNVHLAPNCGWIIVFFSLERDLVSV